MTGEMARNRLGKSVKMREKKTKRETGRMMQRQRHTEGERWRSLPQTGLGTATRRAGDRGTDTPRD